MKGRYFRQENSARPLAEINMVPLIDVMLVLLVIFMIAAPLLTHSVPVNLPQTAGSNQLVSPPGPPLVVSIKADGSLYLGEKPLSRTDLQRSMQAQARLDAAREMHLRADRDTPYHFVAETLADAADAGLTRIGFVGRMTGPDGYRE